MKYFSILDLFENKRSGIFTILNDESTLPKPNIRNFENNLKKAWKNAKSSPISWNVHGKDNIFSICHFTNNVTYSTVCSSSAKH